MPGRRRRFRRRLPAPVRLGELIDRSARRWRFAALAKLEVIRARWPRAAGEYVAAHVAPVRLVRKTLRLAVDDASWASEMTYLAPAILERLKALLPGKWVEDLKVVLTEPMPPIEPPEPGVEMAPEDQDMRDRAKRAAAELSDPDLASAVRRATVARLRRLDATRKPAVDRGERTRSTDHGEDP